MKKSVTIIISFLLSLTLSAQVNFNNNTVSAENYSSALGQNNSSTGLYTLAIGTNNIASDNASFAGGIDSEAIGKYSLAIGDSAKAWSRNSIALGKQVSVFGAYSFGVGENVKTNSTSTMVIGSGYDDYNPLVNNINKSLMIGFYSSKPTLFIGGATGNNLTGKIGIGDVTNPQAKLHIKADDNENASLKLEPTGSSYEAQILLGDDLHKIVAKPNDDFKFSLPSGRNFVFENGKIKTTGFQLTDGQQGEGKYLQSDAAGNASWATSNVPCLDCLASGDYASTIGKYDTATGDMAFAGGINSDAEGPISFAFGSNARTLGTHSTAIGVGTYAQGTYSFALGKHCSAIGSNSFAFGGGQSSTNKLTNSVDNSFMVGFNGYPTLFVSSSYGVANSGRVGIGDITDPQAKLHVKGDENEQAVVFIEPFAFGGSYVSELWIGTPDYGLKTTYGRLHFNTGGNYIFNSADANVGIGTLNPLAKLQVNGEIFIEDENAGLILKSPDGQCWKITVNNSGELTTTSIDCNLSTGAVNMPQPENDVIRIYPNPAKSIITIENTYNYIVYATLRDIEGTLINTQKLQTGDNTINIEALATGTYIVTILDSQNQVLTSEKIMKK